jgi:hypothetical protein
MLIGEAGVSSDRPAGAGSLRAVDEVDELAAWSERVRAQIEEDTSCERVAVAQLTVAQRLERGIALSRFAVRMRDAFGGAAS